jgi:hypothetical protein
MDLNPGRRFVPALVAGGVLALVGAAPACAQSTNAEALIANPFVFNLGAFLVATDVRATLNGQSTNNPEVDFNDSFGTDADETRIRADMLWRLTPNHHLRLLYFDNKVTRNRVIDREIKWGDVTYPVNANVESEVRLKVAAIAYEYAFLRQPTYEFAGTIGIHYSELTMRLSGNTTAAGGFTTESRSLPAPLPMVGLRAGWAVAPNWYVEGLGEFFKVSTDGYDGHWFDAKATATYMFNRNWGLGAGYSRFSTRVDVDKSNFNGNARFGYSGVNLFATASF